MSEESIEQFLDRFTTLLVSYGTASVEVEMAMREVENDPAKSEVAEAALDLRRLYEQSLPMPRPRKWWEWWR